MGIAAAWPEVQVILKICERFGSVVVDTSGQLDGEVTGNIDRSVLLPLQLRISSAAHHSPGAQNVREWGKNLESVDATATDDDRDHTNNENGDKQTLFNALSAGAYRVQDDDADTVQ